MGEVEHNNKFLYDHDHDYLTTKQTMKRFYQQSSSSVEGYQEEEAAFADDAIRGARLRGSIWPPRSYSCSFCKREFRSAQALGGHMNVHRRDRALLKQVITSHNDHDHDHHNHRGRDRDHDRVVSPFSKSSLPQNPSQVCGPRTTSVAHHSLSSRVSTNSVTSGVKKVISSTNEVVQAKISMRLDLAIGKCHEEEDHHHHHQEEYLKYNKRFKKSGDYDVALFPCFEEIKCSIKDNIDLRVPEIMSIEDSKSMEELDLELRLGKPPQKLK